MPTTEYTAPVLVPEIPVGSYSWDALSGKPPTFPATSHTHPKSDCGLGNADNTPDASKPVSTAQAAAIAAAQAAAIATAANDATTKAGNAQAAAISAAATDATTKANNVQTAAAADATTKADAAQAAAIATASADATTKANAAQAAAIAAAANFSVAGAVAAATAKPAIVDADQLGLVDSEAGSALKKITWAALKSALLTYFNGIYASITALNLKAPLASPALTGIPTAPTAADGTNTTQLATCAFVLANAGDAAPLPDALTEYVDAVSPANRRALIGAGTSNAPAPLVLTSAPVDGTTGVLQVETLVITAGAATTEVLNLEIVSNNGMAASDYPIPVTAADSTPALVAAKIREIYATDTVLNLEWAMFGTGDQILFTRQAPAIANDTALLLRLSRDGTTLNSSTNTTAGVAETGTPATGLGQPAVYNGNIYFCTRLTPVKWVCPILA